MQVKELGHHGNEIELYIDVQPERWREDPAAMFRGGARPLRP